MCNKKENIQMGKIWKKVIGVILAVVFVFGAVPGTRVAAEGGSKAGNISLLLEGDAFESFKTMESEGIHIYFKNENDAEYKMLDLSSNSGREHGLIDVENISLYIDQGTSKYNISFQGGSEGAGTSKDTAITLSSPATLRIQIDKPVLTVTWSYDGQTYGEDAYLENGKAEVIGIEGVTDLHDIPFANNPGDEKGGHIAVDAGKKVTVRLTPDYGYQLSGVSLNGGVELMAQADVSTFTFTMPATNVHLKGIFTPKEDTIERSGNIVSGITIEHGANAAASGNLNLKVNDSQTDTSSAQSLVEGAVSAEAVELTLDQVVSKGKDGENWTASLTEFTNPIKLNLAITNYDADYDYTVVREHNGTLTKLETSVSNGTLSFETNRFSTYVIVKREKGTDNATSGNGSSDNTASGSTATNSSAANTSSGKATSTVTGTEIKKAEAQAVCAEGTPAVILENSSEQLLGMAGLTAEEQKAISLGKKTDIILSVSNMTPTQEETALIQSVLGNNVIGQYLNLNLTLKILGREDRQITDLSAPMYIAITIPQNLVNHDSSIERIYRIVRIHDGVATLIDGTYDAATNQFTFATDGFSTYALVYEDVNTTLTGRSPKTGDNSMWMVWTLILCAGCGMTFAAGKRYRKNR